MKYYLKFLLVVFVLSSCTNENDVPSVEEANLQEQSKALFSSSYFNDLKKNYPDLDQAQMINTLEEHDINGQIVYAMDIESEYLEQSKIVFAVNNGTLYKAPVIVESSNSINSAQMDYRVLDSQNNVIQEFSLIDNNGVPLIQSQNRGNCILDCIDSTLRECANQGVEVIVACTISLQILTAVCTMQCIFQ